MQLRLNKYIAQNTDYSRRKADELISAGRVQINDQPVEAGQMVSQTDQVTVDGKLIDNPEKVTPKTILMNKPVGFVCSRAGQGSQTIYELLPPEFQHLNSVGRLDKDSSGLLLLTNDGQLANTLTHPKYKKTKVYEVELNKPLQPLHQQMISDFGIQLNDGPSKLMIEKQDGDACKLIVTMSEGRNRQIRRTFLALGYNVAKLHRIIFGEHKLGNLNSGEIKTI